MPSRDELLGRKGKKGKDRFTPTPGSGGDAPKSGSSDQDFFGRAKAAVGKAFDDPGDLIKTPLKAGLYVLNAIPAAITALAGQAGRALPGDDAGLSGKEFLRNLVLQENAGQVAVRGFRDGGYDFGTYDETNDKLNNYGRALGLFADTGAQVAGSLGTGAEAKAVEKGVSKTAAKLSAGGAIRLSRGELVDVLTSAAIKSGKIDELAGDSLKVAEAAGRIGTKRATSATLTSLESEAVERVFRGLEQVNPVGTGRRVLTVGPGKGALAIPGSARIATALDLAKLKPLPLFARTPTQAGFDIIEELGTKFEKLAPGVEASGGSRLRNAVKGLGPVSPVKRERRSAFKALADGLADDGIKTAALQDLQKVFLRSGQGAAIQTGVSRWASDEYQVGTQATTRAADKALIEKAGWEGRKLKSSALVSLKDAVSDSPQTEVGRAMERYFFADLATVQAPQITVPGAGRNGDYGSVKSLRDWFKEELPGMLASSERKGASTSSGARIIESKLSDFIKATDPANINAKIVNGLEGLRTGSFLTINNDDPLKVALDNAFGVVRDTNGKLTAIDTSLINDKTFDPLASTLTKIGKAKDRAAIATEAAVKANEEFLALTGIPQVEGPARGLVNALEKSLGAVGPDAALSPEFVSQTNALRALRSERQSLIRKAGNKTSVDSAGQKALAALDQKILSSQQALSALPLQQSIALAKTFGITADDIPQLLVNHERDVQVLSALADRRLAASANFRRVVAEKIPSVQGRSLEQSLRDAKNARVGSAQAQLQVIDQEMKVTTGLITDASARYKQFLTSVAISEETRAAAKIGNAEAVAEISSHEAERLALEADNLELTVRQMTLDALGAKSEADQAERVARRLYGRTATKGKLGAVTAEDQITIERAFADKIKLVREGDIYGGVDVDRSFIDTLVLLDSQKWVDITTATGFDDTVGRILTTEDSWRFTTIQRNIGGKDPGQFLSAVNDVTQFWRAQVTARPAFSNRNYVGALFSMSNDIGPVAMSKNVRLAADVYKAVGTADTLLVSKLPFAQRVALDQKLIKRLGFNKAELNDMMDAITRFRTGFGHSELASDGLYTEYNQLGKATNKLNRVGEFLDRKAVPLKSLMGGHDVPVEENVRIAHYLGLTRSGMDSEAAIQRVLMLHNDYTDLSKLDISMKRIFPFWVWRSRNMAMQAHLLATTNYTGRALQLAAMKSRETAEQKDIAIPGFAPQSSIGVSAGLGPASGLLPISGYAGSAQFFDALLSGKKGAANSFLEANALGPAVKIPAQIATGKNFFNGQGYGAENIPAELLPLLTEATRIGAPFGTDLEGRLKPLDGSSTISGIERFLALLGLSTPTYEQQ